MKKVLWGLAAMAMMGMMMTSCQKDEGLSKDTFTATTENGGSKTHLDGLNLKWDDEGESIMVVSWNDAWYAGRTEYFAISVTNDNTCATFACRLGEEVNATSYSIFYPASMFFTTREYPQLPDVQKYAENSVKGFPMGAVTQSHAFQFTNLCGLFRLQLQKTGKSIRKITITTDKAVNGIFGLSTSAAGAFQFEARTANDDAEKTVTLYCGNGVSIDELTDFNIYLPVGTYSTFDITITATDGSQCVKSLNGNVLTINRNERAALTREGVELEFVTASSAPEDAINGLFTVNADGKKVYFSKGNLQNINGEWRFAEHQYDYLGTYSATAWDLFGWSTAATNFGMSTSMSSSSYSGSFVDWGTQIGDGETWETLSYYEWNYVFNTRANAASMKGVATVNGKHGLILLPDTWTLPAGLSFNSGIGSWTLNQYTAAQWELMEAAGAVFLPAAGHRVGTTRGNAETAGTYWSSTPNGVSVAYSMYFYDNTMGYDNYNGRHCGRSVRLVQEYHGN
mgnify:CR=1 FL=1